MARKPRSLDWSDEYLLLIHEPVPGVRAKVPKVCLNNRPTGGFRSVEPAEGEQPGLYVTQHGQHGSGNPNMEVGHSERLLTQGQALKIAAGFDAVASPSRSSVCRLEDDDLEIGVPDTYQQLIEAWYPALARRIDRAIERAADERSMLREVRASLTGKVS